MDLISRNTNRSTSTLWPATGKLDIKSELTKGIELLSTFKGDKFKWYIFGKKRMGILNRYSTNFCSYNSKLPSVMRDFIPDCFLDYSNLITTGIEGDDNVSYELVLFMTWRFPGYDIGLVCVDPADETIYSSAVFFPNQWDNSAFAAHSRVIPPDPLLQEILIDQKRLIQRFHTYKNIIRYTFWSPFTRTDLKDDPIFRVHTLSLEEIDGLDIPQNRKDILRRCVEERNPQQGDGG